MELKGITREWDSLKKDAAARAASAAPYVKEGKIVDAKDAVALLEAVIKPGDKVNIEGNNQKQADFLAKTLCQVDPGKKVSLKSWICPFPDRRQAELPNF